MTVVIVFVIVLCLWLCVWILPAVFWLRSRQADDQQEAAPKQSPEERARAAARAAELLGDVLSEREYEQLKWHGYVDVPSPHYPDRSYRIPSAHGRIRVFVGGKAKADMCIGPSSSLPADDVVALHKLMIAGNEEEYLERANMFPLVLPSELSLMARPTAMWSDILPAPDIDGARTDRVV